MSPGNCCRPLTASYTGSQAPPPVTLSCSLLNPYWPQFFLEHTTNTSSSSPLYLASPLPGKFSAHITVWFTPSLSSFFFSNVALERPFRASLVAQRVKNPPAMQETLVLWRRERLPTPVFWPGESHGLYSPWGVKWNWTQLSDFHFHSKSDLI